MLELILLFFAFLLMSLFLAISQTPDNRIWTRETSKPDNDKRPLPGPKANK